MKFFFKNLIGFVLGFLVCAVIFAYCFSDIILKDEWADNQFVQSEYEFNAWQRISENDYLGAIEIYEGLLIQQANSSTYRFLSNSDYEKFIFLGQLMFLYKRIGDIEKYKNAIQKCLSLSERALGNGISSEEELIFILIRTPRIIEL